MSVTPQSRSRSARIIAAEVVRRVLEEDAYAAAALSLGLSSSRLNPKDRGLCTELVYGTIRTFPYLLRQLERFGKIKASDFTLMSHLAIAAYQLEFLDRVPTHAAVDEAVGAIRVVRGSQVAGFANAILRKVGEKCALVRSPLRDAILASNPSWLRKRMTRDVGEEEAHSLLAPEASPRPFLRFARGVVVPAWVQESCAPIDAVPGVYRFDAGGDPRSHTEYAEGAFSVQELGAVAVGYALGARAGERVLDVCAGRGQKTMILAESVGPEGQVVATDLHQHKVGALREEASRCGLEVEASMWDWTQAPPPAWHGHFDRVMVDAPCSGVGTLRRRPEIARRLLPDSPIRLAELQWKILEQAQLALRPGGLLLFATCSVFREEGADLVSRLCALGGFEPVVPTTEVDGFLSRGLGSVPSLLQLLPGSHNSDGYFLARLRKLASP